VSFYRLSVCVALLLVLGCSDPPETEPTEPAIPEPPAGSLLADPLVPFPELLSETGLFPFAPDLSRVPSMVHGYAPAWPLWSNGLGKSRHLAIPKGAAVDTSDRAAWRFPLGTLFFKTFSDDERHIETRVLRLGNDGWEFAAYRWNDDGADANKLDLKMGVMVDVTTDGAALEHRIPNLLDCRQCHEASPSQVLGFDELRLNHGVDGEQSELERIFEEGVLAGSMPVDPVEVTDADPIAREVRGYLHGNCSNCHNGWTGESSSFDMRHAVALENTVGKPTESSASAPGIRIVPGSPEDSILFLAFSGETDDPEVKAMPPVGIERRDPEAVELLRGFITSLPTR